MTRFVVGDIHGNYAALKSALDKCPIDYEKDTLFVLGDVCDGHPKVKECFDELLLIDDLVYILGNHDHWAREWMRWGVKAWIWTSQGGAATIFSYRGDHNEVPKKHLALLEYESEPYHLTEDRILFVHGGIDPEKPLEEQTSHSMMWDRELFEYAIKQPLVDYNHVYIGHTTTQYVSGDTKPLTFNNLTMMDTGAGGSGKVTIMDVDTGEYWQSDETEHIDWD